MKTLTVYAIAALLVMGTSAALAGDKHNKHDKHHRYGHNWHHNYKHHDYKHHDYRHHDYKHRSHHDGHHQDYYSNYLDVAFLGSALTHSWYHTHRGVACYQRHNNDWR